MSWADRTRWTLDAKLPAILTYLHDQVAQAQSRRDALDAERARRYAAWQACLIRARRRAVDEANTQRLRRHVEAMTYAHNIREFARRLTDHAHGTTDVDLGRQQLEWAIWADAHADHVDPFGTAEDLRRASPEELTVTEIDRFMPSGLTAAHPPRDP